MKEPLPARSQARSDKLPSSLGEWLDDGQSLQLLNPLGYGLGTPDNLLKTPQVDTTLRDNVVAASFLELGVFGGVCYFFGITAMLGTFFSAWQRSRGPFSTAIGAAGIAMVGDLYLASTVLGPVGVSTWTLLGLTACESGFLGCIENGSHSSSI